MALLPFGIPQFKQKKSILGLAFGGAQVGGGVFWFLQMQKRAAWINTEKDMELQTLVASGASADALAEFEVQSEEYIAGLKQQETIGLITFGLGWGASILEALAFSGEESAALPDHATDLQWARASKTKSSKSLGLSPVTFNGQVSAAATFTHSH